MRFPETTDEDTQGRQYTNCNLNLDNRQFIPFITIVT